MTFVLNHVFYIILQYFSNIVSFYKKNGWPVWINYSIKYNFLGAYTCTFYIKIKLHCIPVGDIYCNARKRYRFEAEKNKV